MQAKLSFAINSYLCVQSKQMTYGFSSCLANRYQETILFKLQMLFSQFYYPDTRIYRRAELVARKQNGLRLASHARLPPTVSSKTCKSLA